MKDEWSIDQNTHCIPFSHICTLTFSTGGKANLSLLAVHWCGYHQFVFFLHKDKPWVATLHQTKVYLAQCALVTVSCFHPLTLHISGQNPHFWSFVPHILPLILSSSHIIPLLFIFLLLYTSLSPGGLWGFVRVGQQPNSRGEISKDNGQKQMPRKEFKNPKVIHDDVPFKYSLGLQPITAQCLLEPDAVSWRKHWWCETHRLCNKVKIQS